MFAKTILRSCHGPTQSELIALAWVLRNRATQYDTAAHAGTELNDAQAQQMALELGKDLGSEPCKNGASHSGNGDARASHGELAFQQALACVSLVFDGLVPDPTNGANRVHLHDRAPSWAQGCESAALIGSLLLLREDQPSTQQDRAPAASSQPSANK